MDTLYWILILAVSSALFMFFGHYLSTIKNESKIDVLSQKNKDLNQTLNSEKEAHREVIKEREEQRNYYEKERQSYTVRIAQLEKEKENYQKENEQRKEDLRQLQEQSRKDFELLANKILDEKSEKFTQQNKLNLETVLNPLKERIKDFETKIEHSHKESLQKNASLKQQIEDLTKLNQQITAETVNLTKALKQDTKMQGSWGELVLDRVLEKSGLEEGREYEKQKSFKNEETTIQRPDVVIHLPNHKKMIIDSKVSLTAYERYINEENEEEKENHLKQHLHSIQTHIKQLSEKRYEDIYQIESPDFVLMFIPIEPAFAVAINKDNQLYNKAFEKNIVIVTPTTLLATLRTVDSWWNNEKQQQNAIEIARQAGGLYDKFVGLITDLTKVGKKMDEAKNEYGSAMNKLVEGNGNVIKRIENLKKMGAKASKEIPKNLIERAKDS